MRARTRDRLGSILLLSFVLSLWAQRAYTTPLGGLFPDFVMAALAAIALVTLGLSFTRHAAMPDPGPEGKDAVPVRRLDMAVVGAILLAWTALLRTLGFALCGVAGFAAISWYLADRRRDLRVITSSLVVGALITAILMVVFGWLLRVPLPPGTVFQ